MSLGVSISNMSSVEPQYSSLTVLFGVDDPVICLLLRSRPHLESTGRTMRVMFFDFSSVFNTIQPAPLMEKLEWAGINHHQNAWTIKYLTSRLQFMRLQHCFPEVALCSMGVPQGTDSFLLQFWLQIQHHKLSPPEVLRWYIHRWIWGDRSWV